MIVALPFCSKDAGLALKNLGFVLHIDGKVNVDALLSYDNETPPEMVRRVRDLATKYFRSVKEYQYHAPSTKGWPQAANHAFQWTARHIASEIQEPFLWWEADAVPLRKDWLNDIVAEYGRCLAANKSFMGHLVSGVVKTGHMNGVGVYPADVGRYSRNAMLSTNAAWDVAMSTQMMGHFYPANGLFQHCWATDANGAPTNGSGEIPSFKTWDDVANGPHRADFRAAIYHRCKDGSLIDCYMTRVAERAVPQHRSVAASLATMTKKPLVKKPVTEDCRILVISYWKDFPWLNYCLKAIEKFGSGFSGVTVAIPAQDQDAYWKEIGVRENVKIYRYNEVEGKGMLQHMERMACADEICNSKYVLHVDSDYIAKKPFSVSDFIDPDGRPYYVVRTYASLIDDRGVSDCHQWKVVAERALGQEIDMYTMCLIPQAFPREFYEPFREFIAKVQGVSFYDYVMAQKNSFPQTFADFPTMGAWAWAYMHDRFHWIDIAEEVPPPDVFKGYWSHGKLEHVPPGSTVTAREEIEGFLGQADPKPVKARSKAKQKAVA